MGLFQSPKTFEALHQAYGYVLYCTVIQGHYPSPALLELNNLADRAHLYIDKVRKHEVKIPLDGGLIFLLNYQEFAGILSRTGSLFSMPIQVVHNQSLCILVENQGRFAYGPDIKDFKVNILSFNSMVSAFWILFHSNFFSSAVGFRDWRVTWNSAGKCWPTGAITRCRSMKRKPSISSPAPISKRRIQRKGPCHYSAAHSL